VVMPFICLMLSSSCTPMTSLSLASMSRLNSAMCPRCSMSKQPTVSTTLPSRRTGRLPSDAAIFACSSGHERHPAILFCEAKRGGEVLPVAFLQFSSDSNSCSRPVEGARGAQLSLSAVEGTAITSGHA